jgi:hypothetical protein
MPITPFPFERYELLHGSVAIYRPARKAALARRLQKPIDKANKLLSQLLDAPAPAMQILLVAQEDWQLAPCDETEEPPSLLLLPYWTDVTDPPTLVIPEQLDPIVGSDSPVKLAFLIFHELAHAYLEADPRPWPVESPLWADEWQMQFAALWLAQQIFDVHGIVMTDLHEKYAEIFEPEPDGKTPVTVRGFDWYEDTTAQEYLEYTLLLERFAADLLDRYDATILPRFLVFYREEVTLLSDDVTNLLASVLGEDGSGWLENLVYF